jgi:predicted O-methyltransferase YrrM
MANVDYDYAEYYRTELIPPRKPILDKIEREIMGRDDNIPMIVWPQVERNLYVLAKAVRARRILELGTGIGYATIWLAEATRFCGCKVLTIERDKALAEEAKRNFQDAHISEWIEIKIGRAQQILPTLTEEFDFIFVDVWKGYYVELLQPCVDVLKSNGLLVTARASWTMVKEYLSLACRHPQLETVIWPGCEGLIVSLKI